MKIQILVDNKASWIVPYAEQLLSKLLELDHDTRLIFSHDEVLEGDILCLLSCEKVFKKLALNKFNLVVHESDLPQGKGWSPVTWQVLEGKNTIPVTLFEAAASIDSGQIYSQAYISLDGTELLEEIKHQQGLVTQALIMNFIERIPNIQGRPQCGDESFYPRRNPEDSRLDIHKSLYDQFDLLRVCDNERYPAHFTMRNEEYVLKIYKKR